MGRIPPKRIGGEKAILREYTVLESKKVLSEEKAILKEFTIFESYN